MNNRGLHLFALLTSAAAFLLLGAGGLVTSHGVGMAVPDWPNSCGYNMFFFPASQWVGGIFYEHTHRLIASGVGLLTTILVLWLHGRKAQPFMFWAGLVMLVVALASWLKFPARWTDALVLGASGIACFGGSFVWPKCEPAPKWLRWCGIVAFIAVVLQGVLGGLRVVLHMDGLGVFHAMLAQLFFVLMCSIALFSSRWWQNLPAQTIPAINRRFTWLFAAASILIFGQLILGAAMRHQHAGLSIPDFPLAYGKLWPATDPASVQLYNQRRLEVLSVNPITAFQIVLQMVHRIMAMLILATVAFCAWSARRELGKSNLMSKAALGWVVLILAQACLGAFTIWSDKAADVATAHVLVGALSLLTGALLCIVSRRYVTSARRVAESPTAQAMPQTPLMAHGAGMGK